MNEWRMAEVRSRELGIEVYDRVKLSNGYCAGILFEEWLHEGSNDRREVKKIPG
jgi:hypothetical protein